MSKKNEEVVEVQEAEFTEVEEAVAVEESPVSTEIKVGIKEDGSIYVVLSGTNQNLIVADGLLDYGKREMDKIWANKMNLNQ